MSSEELQRVEQTVVVGVRADEKPNDFGFAFADANSPIRSSDSY